MSTASFFLSERPDPERPARVNVVTAEWLDPRGDKRGRVVCSCEYKSEWFRGPKAEGYVATLLLQHRRAHRDP